MGIAMKTFILLYEKSWHEELFENLRIKLSANWIRIDKKEDFTFDKINVIKPDCIFIPHWSYFIPSEIYLNYECIVFHMTDLPYGRGGSPLQNLIVLNHEETLISALHVDEGIDTGPVYLKSKLSLLGTAEEIFIRSISVVMNMIISIIENNLQPTPQTGSAFVFKRRKKSDGDVSKLSDINTMYNYIRMLDAEGYPNAFLETDNFQFEFSRASLKANETIIADVRITKK
jgi:methionyl-tRNA formyltransferase